MRDQDTVRGVSTTSSLVRSPDFMMSSTGMSLSFDETSSINMQKESHISEERTHDSTSASIMSHDTIDRENFREEAPDGQNKEPVIMESISSFLETMHSKNLTLQKLAKVQQRRIEELSQENKALRQASEMKDEEILKIKAHFNTDASARSDRPTKRHFRIPKQKKSYSKKGLFSATALSASKSSTTATAGNGQSNEASADQRHTPSIIVSHKVAMNRVRRLMRKINSSYSRKNVGLYIFVLASSHIAVPLSSSNFR